MLFERTRYLFSMLGSYLSPSTLFGARTSSIILVGAGPSTPGYETIKVRRIGAGTSGTANGNGDGNGNGHDGLDAGEEMIGVKQVSDQSSIRLALAWIFLCFRFRRLHVLTFCFCSFKTTVDHGFMCKSPRIVYPELVALE